ncbi:hypothetical protein OG225_40850 (plasmid) [Nocardia sp. NBC_01377]|uniref:hypothetical protein n=1 Tax=Nocardia sp. NBC_01377 TaxID=2903595 RepID=UPI002F91AA47
MTQPPIQDIGTHPHPGHIRDVDNAHDTAPVIDSPTHATPSTRSLADTPAIDHHDQPAPASKSLVCLIPYPFGADGGSLSSM